jgi:hypothetical protein
MALWYAPTYATSMPELARERESAGDEGQRLLRRQAVCCG